MRTRRALGAADLDHATLTRTSRDLKRIDTRLHLERSWAYMSTQRLVHTVAIFVGATSCTLSEPADPSEANSIEPDAVGITLSVTTKSSSSLALSWTAVQGATEYVITRGSASGTEKNLTTNSPATSTTFTDSHLSASEPLCYVIEAFTGSQLSATSNEQCVSTPAAIAAPSGLTATLDHCCTPQRVNLEWQGVSGALRYYILESASNGPFKAVSSVTAPTDSATIAGLTAGTTYGFEVETEDASGNISAPSAPVNVTLSGSASGTKPGVITSVSLNQNSRTTTITGTGLDWLGDAGSSYVVCAQGSNAPSEGQTIGQTFPSTPTVSATQDVVDGIVRPDFIFVCPAGTTTYSSTICTNAVADFVGG